MPKPLRADAARNRDRLSSAAAEIFAERGLDAPLEEIARRAGVSIGTLYNHFASRDALLDAIFPGRLSAVLDGLAADALAADDPWAGFAEFVEELLARQSEDQGLSDVLAQRRPVPPEVADACARGLNRVTEILTRAQRSGALRRDFTVTDLATLVLSVSQLIRDTRATVPDAWRRHLAFHLDGLRAEADHPVSVPPVPGDAISALTPDAGSA